MVNAPAGIYLDYAATTPVDLEASNKMCEFLTYGGLFGNPHSTSHRFGQAAAQAIKEARQNVAQLIGADADNIYWTSGATEAINLAIKGIMLSPNVSGHRLLVSSLEHKAVLDTANWLTQRGIPVDWMHPDKDGLITPSLVKSHLRSDTALVSVMHINNEIGTITDITEIARIAHQHGTLVHIDAAQSAARLPIDVTGMDMDMLSLSGHKLYGPKGSGALFMRREVRSIIEPQIHGGGQEGGLRSGTLATHQIAGFGIATRIMRERLQEDSHHAADMDGRILDWLQKIDGVRLNGNQNVRTPGILSASFEGVEAESLMLALGDIAVSSGSACTTSQVEPSHVLLGLGLSEDRALSSIRFSPGRYTTRADIDTVGHRLIDAVTALRSIAA